MDFADDEEFESREVFAIDIHPIDTREERVHAKLSNILMLHRELSSPVRQRLVTLMVKMSYSERCQGDEDQERRGSIFISLSELLEDVQDRLVKDLHREKKCLGSIRKRNFLVTSHLKTTVDMIRESLNVE